MAIIFHIDTLMHATLYYAWLAVIIGYGVLV